MNGTIPIENIKGEALTTAQRDYLEGVFRRVGRAPSFQMSIQHPNPDRPVQQADLIFEERQKGAAPLDAYPQLLQNAASNRGAGQESTFRFKWNGLFIGPEQRRFHGAPARSWRAGENISCEKLPRSSRNLQPAMRRSHGEQISRSGSSNPKTHPKCCAAFKKWDCTRGAGADNIRNLTANPTAGIDPASYSMLHPLCGTRPYHH
jgi:ferredoxin-nitrite reductase